MAGLDRQSTAVQDMQQKARSYLLQSCSFMLLCRLSQGLLAVPTHLLQQLLVLLPQPLQGEAVLADLLLGLTQLLLVGLGLQSGLPHLLYLHTIHSSIRRTTYCCGTVQTVLPKHVVKSACDTAGTVKEGGVSMHYVSCDFACDA